MMEKPKTNSGGFAPGDTRATFLINSEVLEKLRALAYWDRTSIKVTLEEALLLYFEKRGEKYVKNAVSEYRKGQK